MHRAADLTAGAELLGPAFVDGPESTTLVPPGFVLTVDAVRNLHLRPVSP